MLKDIKAPTHTKSKDCAPDKTRAQKIAIVREYLEARPRFRRAVTGRGFHYALRGAPLPGVHFSFVLDPRQSSGREEANLFVERLDLGDADLYGHGLGTTLLQWGIEKGYRASSDLNADGPPLTSLSAGPANLPLLNTIIKVAGHDNVSITMRGEHYGRNQSKPLEQVLEDYRYGGENDRYRVQAVHAPIDPLVIIEELPAASRV